MILGIDLLTALVLDLKFYKYVIIRGDGPYEGWSAAMSDVNYYEFKYLTEKLSNRNNPLLISMSKNASGQKVQLVQPN